MNPETKTPQFHKTLENYFANLKLDEKGGQMRVCRFSENKFYVRPEDIAFYKRIGVPLPTLEPEERRRRRCAAKNCYNLFWRTSAFSGEKIISIYPPSSPVKAYEPKAWYGDGWNPTDYAHAYNPEKSFFEEFHKLQLAVPHPCLVTDPGNINSDYTNTSKSLKNSYIVFDQNVGENLYYHQCCSEDRNCIDCWAIDFCDTCYGCKLSDHLYKCFFSEQCRNCIDSLFLWDCRNCANCFMSSNLRHKKYFFRNEYLGKEEYERRMKEISRGNYGELQKLLKEYEVMKQRTPRKPNWNEKSVNSLGNFIRNSKNCYYCLWAMESENLTYCEGLVSSRDSYDVTGGINGQLNYEHYGNWVENNYNCKFVLDVDNCQDSEFIDTCSNCKNCFGCVGLRNKEFCIFNMQYSEDEYWKKVDEIKTAMLARGEYGEFFPPRYLLVPYKTSLAVSFQGFRDFEKAEKYEYDITEVEQPTNFAEGKIIASKDLPQDIKNVGDEIVNSIVRDEANNKMFRIIKQELEFYRIHNLPLPREHPSIRMQKWRDSFDISLEFYTRKCPKCGASFDSSYAPSAPEIVYCEKCYQNALI